MITYKLLLEAISESNLNKLKKKHKDISTEHDPSAVHKTPHDIINHFGTNADPTKEGKHTSWIMDQYKKKNVKQEDDQDIHQTLSDFEKYKHKLTNKDINSKEYDHIDKLKAALEPHTGTDPQYKEPTSHPDAPLVHEGNGIKVHALNSKEASRHYFKGGSVCTARSDEGCQHDNYSKDGQLYHVKGKNAKGKTTDYNLFFKNSSESNHDSELANKKTNMI